MSASTSAPAVRTPVLPMEIRSLVDLAKQIQRITTPEERGHVALLHAKFAAERRDNEAMQKEVLAPILKLERDTRAPFKLAVDTCQLWETHCENSLRVYDREQVRLARVKQEEENRKTAAANAAAVQRAEEKGVAPITRAPKIIETNAPKVVKSEEGLSSSRREVTLWRFVGVTQDEDPSKILASDVRLAKLGREFLLPNITRINQAVKMGGNEAELLAQGIEVYKDFDYTGRGGR